MRASAPGQPTLTTHNSWGRLQTLVSCQVFPTIPTVFSVSRAAQATKVILYAWVNDEGTRRAYESGDDAYRIFRKMLESGQPPDDWDQLLAEARAESDHLQKLVAQTTAGAIPTDV